MVGAYCSLTTVGVVVVVVVVKGAASQAGVFGGQIVAVGTWVVAAWVAVAMTVVVTWAVAIVQDIYLVEWRYKNN